MMALSVRQPYAFAIVMGFKPVENRVWETPYRGSVLIHAGKKEERDDIYAVVAQIARQTQTGRTETLELYKRMRARGAIVGRADVVACTSAMDSPWFQGPYGFLLENAEWCEPIPCKGMLGFFDIPDDLEARVAHDTEFNEFPA